MIKVIPNLEELREHSWRVWSISSDNGPHFAQSYIFYALSQIALPSSVTEVRWSFDCPYHGSLSPTRAAVTRVTKASVAVDWGPQHDQSSVRTVDLIRNFKKGEATVIL